MSDYILREIGKALERPIWTSNAISMSHSSNGSGSCGNLTAHDAVYVALAEALGTVVLTCDRRLSLAPGMVGRVVLVE